MVFELEVSRVTTFASEDTNLNRKLGWSLCLLTLALCVSSLPAAAGDYAYNNLGSPASYQCCTGWTIGGSQSLVGLVEDAQQFTAAVGGNVSQIDVALGFVTGDNMATVSLWTNNNGAPGTELFSAGVSNQPVFGQSTSQLSTIMVSGVNITAGEQYFVVIEADNVTWDAWNLNDTGAVGLLDQNSGSGWNQFQGSTLGGFDVQVNGGGTTPEPSSFLLLGTGVFGAFCTIRRKLNR